MLQQTAEAKKIVEQAVEKDWWVSVILAALTKTSWADFLQFKGGTSLSKAWGLISRFSEDIDLAVSRSFVGLPDDTNQQRMTIRRKAFHYITETLSGELNEALTASGIAGYEIKPVTENSSAMAVEIEVRYNSVLPTILDYVKPVVKIEFSAMSLDEPFEDKEMSSLINFVYPEIDSEIKCSFRTVLPERTFLEKIFLLHEEYQKENPRTTRMSRHLYDLEKMMDTDFARSALQNAELYKTVVAHRRKFNSISGIDYDTHYPASVRVCPPDNLTAAWQKDYDDLRQSFIYEKRPKSFDELSNRLQELTGRIRSMTTPIKPTYE
ncbi:MAG: nucleotidyl transferase AbiEii/AbiGii toxin family protein [Tannerella sp.]|nr:nucleotidyl transferase AbiEii/AbiGii toxin family protein [Tannerella sp.]